MMLTGARTRTQNARDGMDVDVDVDVEALRDDWLIESSLKTLDRPSSPK